MISVDPDGAGNVWVFHRSEPPLLKFGSSGKLLKSLGEGMFVQPHGLHIDRDGFIWATDAQAKGGKGMQVFKFSPEGRWARREWRAKAPSGGKVPRSVETVRAAERDLHCEG